jgi:hypothetical protein
MRRKIDALESDEAVRLRRPGIAPTPRARTSTTRRCAALTLARRVRQRYQVRGREPDAPHALGMLGELEEPTRREALFRAFQPLWLAINGHDERDSPYRRVIRAAAQEAARSGSEIDAAARTLGVKPADVEAWLERVLDAWRAATEGSALEPWDYRYAGGAADRALRDSIPRQAFAEINQRYYFDLGADLQSMGVLYDLDERPGKAPLAYADFVTRGRTVDRAWRPTVTRVSASYATGGLGLLNELVHENGHVVHMMAVRARPAFMDLGDGLFVEAFADVPSWNTYEPAWQRKYVGRDVDESTPLRALYSGVMLDVAHVRGPHAAEPESDPNAVWTDITSRYLHVRPHPELSWWAVRPARRLARLHGQLRARRRVDGRPASTHSRRAGSVRGRQSRWYGWLPRAAARRRVDRHADLLRRFLGRLVTPDALPADCANSKTVAQPRTCLRPRSVPQTTRCQSIGSIRRMAPQARPLRRTADRPGPA